GWHEATHRFRRRAGRHRESSHLGTNLLTLTTRAGPRHCREGGFPVTRRFLSAPWLVLALTALGYGQTFEVASLKVLPPANSGDRRTPPSIEPTTGNLAMRNVGMGELIMWAYKVGRAQVSNPEVAMAITDRFDIIAKAAGPAKTDELRLM